MSRFVKFLSFFVAVLIVCMVALISQIERSRARSAAEVQRLVARFNPGTPLEEVTRQLGHDTRTFTLLDEIRIFGTARDESVITNRVLHAFVHMGPPIRWILVYTDKQTSRVLFVAAKDL